MQARWMLGQEPLMQACWILGQEPLMQARWMLGQEPLMLGQEPLMQLDQPCAEKPRDPPRAGSNKKVRSLTTGLVQNGLSPLDLGPAGRRSDAVDNLPHNRFLCFPENLLICEMQPRLERRPMPPPKQFIHQPQPHMRPSHLCTNILSLHGSHWMRQNGHAYIHAIFL